jgi:hypothetical protein
MASKSAGYSGTPLPKKLGIREGHRVALVSAPSGFEDLLGSVVATATVSRRLRGAADIFLFFPKNARDLERRLSDLVPRLESDGGLWIAWPKKSSGATTDLDFETVQGAGLSAGLVDNKVCAVDEVYSGLRFVFRLEDRPAREPPAR